MFKGGRMILGDLSDRPTIKAHHSSIIMVVQTVWGDTPEAVVTAVHKVSLCPSTLHIVQPYCSITPPIVGIGDGT